jgi:hypothetical protein
MFNQKSMLKVKSLCLAMLAGLILCGCNGPEPHDLPFETLERADSAGTGEYYEDEEPKLVIVTGAEEIDLLGNTISLDAQAQLRSLDFDRYVAIVAFQGWRPVIPAPRSGVEIQRIEKRGNTITIFAQLYEPVEDLVKRPLVISAYHIAKIPKGGDIQGEFKFVLEVDGKSVARQTHFIP